MNFLKWILGYGYLGSFIYWHHDFGFFSRIFSRFCRSYYPYCHFIFSMVIF